MTLVRSRRPADQLAETHVDPRPDPAQAVAGQERFTEVLEDVQALSPRARQILIMKEFAGLDRGDIAEALQLSPHTVSQALSDARSRLRGKRHGREKRMAGILPAPGLVRWIDAWFSTGQGVALLGGVPSPAVVSSRSLAVLVSLTAG